MGIGIAIKFDDGKGNITVFLQTNGMRYRKMKKLCDKLNSELIGDRDSFDTTKHEIGFFIQEIKSLKK